MTCKWIRYFGDYGFTTSCGCFQGINIRPKQKKCMCGKKIERYIQDSNGSIHEVTRVEVVKGTAYYYK